MRRRTKGLFLLSGAAGALALALPVLAQNAPESLLPPGFGTTPPPAPRPRPAPAQAVPAQRPVSPPAQGTSRTAPAPAQARPAPAPGQPAPVPVQPTAAVPEIAAPPPPPVAPSATADEGVAVVDATLPTINPDEVQVDTQPEMPPAARRAIDLVGTNDFYGQDAFGDVDGRYLVTLMRRLDAPIASRWVEIMLRRVLLTRTAAPAGEGQADWLADRAALLLKLGEVDGARAIVQAADVQDFSPRLRRVAIEAALAAADPAGLCPLPDGDERVGGQPLWPMVRSMCATLSGDVATANATIGRAPPNDPIDHALAEKLVAAAGGGRGTVTIDWTAVDGLTEWRFGMASALGVAIPQALLDNSPAWYQSWLARAPMLQAADRIAPARIAASLGTLSSADLVDLYGRAMDEAGDEDRDSPSAKLRTAYRGDDDDARLSAIHALWDAAANGQGGERDRYAASILTARAAAGIKPASDQRDDVEALVASMFAAGLDEQAEHWASIAENTSGADGDKAWAILAVGARRPVVSVTVKRIEGIAKRDGDEGRHRAAMLAAALVGLGRLPQADAAPLMAGETTTPPYARALERAVAGSQRGTVALLVAVGMQTPRWGGVPAGDFARMIAALRAVGMEGEARMIAAEAMSRL